VPSLVKENSMEDHPVFSNDYALGFLRFLEERGIPTTVFLKSQGIEIGDETFKWSSQVFHE